MTVRALRLKLNPSLGVPLYRQIMDGIKEQIAAKTLAPGARLPSIREVSSTLRINPSSVVKAYTELKHAGVIELDQGRGTFVSKDPGVTTSSASELLERDLVAVLDRAVARGFSEKQALEVLQRLVAGRRSKA